jgi:hypothetical protein
MNWMIVALLLNGSGGVSGAIETNIVYRSAEDCVENLAPVAAKFSAVSEKMLRQNGSAKRGDSTPRYYKNVQWTCFPTQEKESPTKQ